MSPEHNDAPLHARGEKECVFSVQAMNKSHDILSRALEQSSCVNFHVISSEADVCEHVPLRRVDSRRRRGKDHSCSLR